MRLQQLTYDVSRRYLQDQKPYLPPDVFQTCMGWIRSRSLRKLTTSSDLFVEALHPTIVLRTLLQVESFFKKNSAFTDERSLQSSTHEAFMASEKHCMLTNRALMHLYNDESLDPSTYRLLERARKYVARTLGEIDSFFESLPLYVKVTAGASATKSRTESTPYKKVSLRPTCTVGALPYLLAYAKSKGVDSMQPQVVSYNRVIQVPKNWKTNRTIACEPEGNVFLQLAFDSYCKGKLRRVGVNLSDQSKNRALAWHGSILNTYATIDLSAASDTISRMLVAWLLPDDWYAFLDSIRCTHGTAMSQEFIYEKFSSMGNGSTFTLETLVFLAICKAAGCGFVSVYGDDIVVSNDKYETAVLALSLCGFLPNMEKSYHTGSFRESCGGSFYRGEDVTPFYIREMDRRKATLCHIVNGLKAICTPGGLLDALLREIVKEFHLPYVPWSEDTLSGVHVDVQTAYTLKLFSYRRNHRDSGELEVCAKRYIAESFSVSVRRSSKALFLWHVQAETTARKPVHRMMPGITEPIVTSRYSHPTHRYVRVWAPWIHPGGRAPSHVYDWE